MSYRYFPMSALTALSLVALALVLSACEENTSPGTADSRYVYYAASGPGEPGLYRYNLVDGTSQHLESKRADYITRVASNGIVLFDAPDLAHRLYGICEDGAIIPVPFPVSDNPAMEFTYAVPPRLALAAHGHHAVYAVDLVPSGGPPTTLRTSHLVLFDCLRWKMKLINVDSLFAAGVAGQNINGGFVAGEHLFINPSGTAVWFTAGLLSGTGQGDTLGYVLTEWTSEGLRLLRPIHPEPTLALGYNAFTGTLILNEAGTVQALRLASDALLPYEAEDPSNLQPWQFGSDLDISAHWEDDGIVIRKAATGRLVWRIAELEQFEQVGDEGYNVTHPGNHVAISPDGRWIAVTLTYKRNAQYCDVFAVRSNGQEITLLAKGLPLGFPSISPLINP